MRFTPQERAFLRGILKHLRRFFVSMGGVVSPSAARLLFPLRHGKLMHILTRAPADLCLPGGGRRRQP